MDAYFDCFSGISGDMILGSFLDMGVPRSFLKEALHSLLNDDFDIIAEKLTRESISVTNCHVMFHKKPEMMKYHKILDLITSSNLSIGVKQQSIEIFNCIANAESKIHKCNVDQVHFHEIGALDSIVDVVGTAICIEYLDIDNIFSSELPVGSGFTKCEHGVLPVPVPATLEILKGIPIYSGRVKGELVTPTGAGIIATTAKHFGNIPDMIVKKVGYGCGKTVRIEYPNILRIMLGNFLDPHSTTKTKSVSIIETSIDDMNPEIYSFLIERLFSFGAFDVCFIPVTMKKSRPGVKLEIICPEHLRAKMIEELLSQTTTLGVRYYSAKRSILQRSTTTIKTNELGKVKVKVSIQSNGSKEYSPEYDVCENIAKKKNVPIKKIYDIINNAIYRLQL